MEASSPHLEKPLDVPRERHRREEGEIRVPLHQELKAAPGYVSEGRGPGGAVHDVKELGGDEGQVERFTMSWIRPS